VRDAKRRGRGVQIVHLGLIVAWVLALNPEAMAKGMTLHLAQEWRRARHRARWRSPSPQQRDLLREAARYAMRAAADCSAAHEQELRRRLNYSSFELVTLKADGAKVWLLREVSRARHGGGLYAFRCGAARPWLLQAPHAFFDVGSGLLVRKLFMESGARAAFWNTVHRYRALPGERREDRVHPADVAHQFGSLFHAVTMGAATASTKDAPLKVIQVHGSDLSRERFDVVVSYGQRRPLAAALGVALGPSLGRVAVYGRDMHRLGGTTNVQGIALRRAGVGHFLHLELSRPAREILKKRRKKRAGLISALAGPWP